VAGFPPLTLFVVVMFQGRLFARLYVLIPDGPAGSTTFAAKSRFVAASMPITNADILQHSNHS